MEGSVTFLRSLFRPPRLDSQAICEGCGSPIHGLGITALERTWHPSHFCCALCRKPLGRSFRVSPHREPFCASHPEGEALCGACGHVNPQGQALGGFCAVCARDIPSDVLQVEPIQLSVQSWLREAGLPWWPQTFPLRLVDPTEFEPQGARPAASLAGQIVKETETVAGGRCIRKVPMIRLLKGQPRILLGSVLAHELGHAWVFQSGLTDLPADLEEGFCEFCAHLWLNGTGDPRASFLMDRIARNPDPIYGRGFRKVATFGERGGLPSILAHLKGEPGNRHA